MQGAIQRKIFGSEVKRIRETQVFGIQLRRKLGLVRALGSATRAVSFQCLKLVVILRNSPARKRQMPVQRYYKFHFSCAFRRSANPNNPFTNDRKHGSLKTLKKKNNFSTEFYQFCKRVNVSCTFST